MKRFLLITEHEIFQKKLKRRFRRQHVSNAERLKDYNELEKGDYVVHHIHGIGQYLGIETIEIKGIRPRLCQCAVSKWGSNLYPSRTDSSTV